MIAFPGLSLCVASLLPLASRPAAGDLHVTGAVEGYVSAAALQSRLPVHATGIRGEFSAGTARARYVFLADVMAALGATESDVVLASCSDGYLSVFPRAFIARYRPLVVLSVDGHPPEQPFVITVAETVAPGVEQVRDVEHKRPWGVVELRFARYAACFGVLERGAYAQAGPAAARGREIWIHSCASCHAGPAGIPGGTRSGLTFDVLQAIARANPDFFSRYVRDPRSLVPAARMEPHPKYSDAELGDLIAFVGVSSGTGR